MVFVLVSRSRKLVPDELVTLMSLDSRDNLADFVKCVAWLRTVELPRSVCWLNAVH